MGSQRGLYTSRARSRTSFLRFHGGPAREYSPSLSRLSVGSGQDESEGPVTPTHRPLTGVDRAPSSSSPTPFCSDSPALPAGNEDHAWNLLHLLSVTFSTGDTVTFDIFGSFELSTEEYHDSWMEWWQGTSGYIAYTAKYAAKKKIQENSDLRGTEGWKHFQQCAVRLGTAIGTPRVRCIMSRKVLAHPSCTELARCMTITGPLLV